MPEPPGDVGGKPAGKDWDGGSRAAVLPDEDGVGEVGINCELDEDVAFRFVNKKLPCFFITRN